MDSALAGELTVLATRLLRIARADRRTRDHTLNSLRQALAEIVACFPVYRTYVTGGASGDYAPGPPLHRLGGCPGEAPQPRRRSEHVRLREERSHRASGVQRARACVPRVRHALSAVHFAGHRKRRRRHELLCLQPAGLAERRRGRSRRLRHGGLRVSRRERRSGGPLAAHDARDLHSRQQALGGRARANQCHFRAARGVAARRARAGVA